MPAFACDGSTVRLTRRAEGGLQVVAWALRPDGTASSWWRWASPIVTTVGELQDSWLRTQQFQGGEPGQLRTLEGLSAWQVYSYRARVGQLPVDRRCDASPLRPVAHRQRPPRRAGRAARRPHRPQLCAGQRTERQPDARLPRHAMNARRLGRRCQRARTGARRPARRRPADRDDHRDAGGDAGGVDGVAAVARGAGRRRRTGARAVGLDPRRRARLGAPDPEGGRSQQRRPNSVDHLGEPWAVPLAEARLSTFLAADQSNTDDAPDAFLSGLITDAQSRFNVMNLVKADGTVDPDQVESPVPAVRGRPASRPTSPPGSQRPRTGRREARRRRRPRR